MEKIAAKPFVNYHWQDNLLLMGEVEVGVIKETPQGWIVLDILTPQMKQNIKTRGEAVHWLTEQMLDWLKKAGISKVVDDKVKLY